MANETAAQRFDRDYGQIPEQDRVDRELNNQSLERVRRLYVNAADGTTPADDDNVNN